MKLQESSTLSFIIVIASLLTLGLSFPGETMATRCRVTQ